MQESTRKAVINDLSQTHQRAHLEDNSCESAKTVWPVHDPKKSTYVVPKPRSYSTSEKDFRFAY